MSPEEGAFIRSDDRVIGSSGDLQMIRLSDHPITG
jgi:hypothetical protein